MLLRCVVRYADSFNLHRLEPTPESLSRLLGLKRYTGAAASDGWSTSSFLSRGAGSVSVRLLPRRRRAEKASPHISVATHDKLLELSLRADTLSAYTLRLRMSARGTGVIMPDSELSDHQIGEAFCASSETVRKAALETLVRKYAASFANYALHLAFEGTDYKDILQEAYRRAWVGLAGFDPKRGAGPKHWLLTIIYHVARTRPSGIRASGCVKEGSKSVSAQQHEAVDAEALIEQIAAFVYVLAGQEQAIAKLDLRSLKCFSELPSPGEVERELGIPCAQVSVVRARYIKKLRAFLRDRGYN